MSARLTGLLTAIPVTHNKYVFPDQREMINDRNRRAGLSTQFGRLCARCGLEGNFHLLRHGAATREANSEMAEILKIVKELGIEKARKLLGHKHGKTTERYVH